MKTQNIARAALFAAALMLAACAGHSTPTPDAAPVQRRVTNAATSNNSAQGHTTSAQGHVSAARTDAQAIDDKVVRLLN